jgi:ATP-binding cassette subfamily B protein
MEITKRSLVLQKQKAGIAAAGILMALGVSAGVMSILLVLKVFEQLLSPVPDVADLTLYLVLIAVFLVLKVLLYAVSLIVSHLAAYEALADIRLLLLEHLKRLPLGFFQKKSSGELTKIINRDVEQIELQLAHALPDTFATVSVSALILAAVFIIEWKMALAMVAFLPLVFLTIFAFSRWWQKTAAAYSQRLAEMFAGLMEFVATIPVIKAFGREEDRTAVLEAKMDRYRRWATKQIIVFTAPMGILGIFLEGGFILTP